MKILNIFKIIFLYIIGITISSIIFSWIFASFIYHPSKYDLSKYNPKYGNLAKQKESEYSMLGFVIGFVSGIPIVLTSRFFWNYRIKRKDKKLRLS